MLNTPSSSGKADNNISSTRSTTNIRKQQHALFQSSTHKQGLHDVQLPSVASHPTFGYPPPLVMMME
ncbi:hypothetical protein H5410_055578 [Solanum commersonii]|uniref:Uncharacterized protein n=1 Tax=Solanum commersonii TaxID=4109 RepID=A0A9J5WJS3_SOLCO|nr:hypothetical protein H5410_055578 [Solanum commersonii]